ncbi:DUF257 family protein [Palaeococcus ferrophilus]|uniref:DUF257 family protein n=1 Tax=Palaeococcus ferrophilus TaxID=83868 RepID=UPI001FE0AF21|nr:DUF257 family protein [Palaeococcus ferrophilus]
MDELIATLREARWGEVVLFEYSSYQPVHIMFKKAVEVARMENTSLLIVDVLDTLVPIKKALEITEGESNIFDGLDVIKGGGKVPIGNVVDRIELSADSAVYFSRLISRLSRYYSSHEKTVTFLWNIEGIVNLHSGDPKILPQLEGIMRSFVGDERRVAVYFINRDVAPDELLAIIEEIATTVLTVDYEDGTFVLSLKKAPENRGKKVVRVEV